MLVSLPRGDNLLPVLCTRRPESDPEVWVCSCCSRAAVCYMPLCSLAMPVRLIHSFVYDRWHRRAVCAAPHHPSREHSSLSAKNHATSAKAPLPYSSCPLGSCLRLSVSLGQRHVTAPWHADTSIAAALDEPVLWLLRSAWRRGSCTLATCLASPALSTATTPPPLPTGHKSTRSSPTRPTSRK